jgi:predicted phosphodiesterase
MLRLILTSDTHYGFYPSKTALILNKFVRKLAKENPDVVLHAGDWGSTKQKEVESCVKMFRRILPETPIVGVLGNHCYGSLDKVGILLSDTIHNLKRVFDENNVISHFKQDNVEIFGYNSWYKTNRPPSNDHRWIAPLTKEDAEENFYDWIPLPISRNIHQYLLEKSYLNCQDVCERLKASDAKHKVVVTHFESIEYRGDPFYDGMKGSYVEYEMLMEAGATIICYGHSHRVSDFINEKGVRVLNCGSDYNEPKFTVIELC